MSTRVGSFVFLVIFSILAAMTSRMIWLVYGWLLIPQLLLIFAIAAIGESMISSQGYYFYTRHERNGPFMRNVPIWIIFLWIYFIQVGLLLSFAIGLDGLSAAMMSGMIACTSDFIIVEPFLSRYMGLWKWTSVKRGYFSFIPARLNRFTAPPGNYITWLLFPTIVNAFVLFLGIML